MRRCVTLILTICAVLTAVASAGSADVVYVSSSGSVSAALPPLGSMASVRGATAVPSLVLPPPSRLAMALIKAGTGMDLSPTDFITRLILQVLQAKQSIIPTTIGINQKVSLMGTDIHINTLTFNKPMLNTVTVYKLATTAKGVFDVSVGVGASFPDAQLHVSIGTDAEEAVDFGTLVLFVNGSTTGLALPCADGATDVQRGTLAISGVQFTSTSSDPIVGLLTGIINKNSAIINTVLSTMTNGLVPSHFALPSNLLPIIGIVCSFLPDPPQRAPHLVALAAPGLSLDPTSFLTQVINAIVKSNPTITISGKTSRIGSLDLSGVSEINPSTSWGGLNDACRVGCQIPCQTEYGACKAAWAACEAVCWLGCSCPDCEGARDSCLNACQGTCHYDLHASAGITGVDGLNGVVLSNLKLNSAAHTASGTLSIPTLPVHLKVDVSVIPTITDTESVNALTVNLNLKYSCPTPGNVHIEISSLSGSPFDLDSVFKFFHSTVGKIPFGLGDKFNSWLTGEQQSITNALTGVLTKVLNGALPDSIAVPAGLNVCV